MIAFLILGLAPLVIWAGLLTVHGGFWLARERDDRDAPPAPAVWPSIVAVVPARDEADVIARSIGSLLIQEYPGPFRVILVDDQSGDGTAEVARTRAERLDQAERLEIIAGQPLPLGWTGKLWAMSQGVERAQAVHAPKYLWLTDADIGHTQDNLRALVAHAEARGLTLTSLMAELHCRTLAERFLVPAFVLFFQMLYPFPRVNRPGRTAAAAGGCMLARSDALTAAGGVAAIRNALIDDCAMGALMKAQGPVWLGLTHRSVSLRPYRTIAEIGRMISRSAYAQLDYSPIKLVGVVAGMGLVFLAPVAAMLFGGTVLKVVGIVVWLMMALSFQPMLRFYRRSPLWGLALPAIGAAYTAFTVQSAVQTWRGRGGLWKGRAQAMA